MVKASAEEKAQASRFSKGEKRGFITGTEKLELPKQHKPAKTGRKIAVAFSSTRSRLDSAKSSTKDYPHKRQQPSKQNDVIYVRYLDHVMYNRCIALALKPQIREAVGWLVYEGADYINFAWDRDAEPPTLQGKRKASGLVLLKTDILEMKKIA
jgi:hypothetical protein